MGQIKKLSEIKTTGIMAMIYGETGVGKTVSVLQSSPQPILYVKIEERNIMPSVEATGLKSIDVDVLQYDDWRGLLDVLTDFEKLKRYKTILVDSFSHLMGVALSSEIENETFEARSEKERKRKSIIMQAKMTQEGYGGLSSQMLRLCRVLGKLSSIEGKVVICTALLDEHPKYDRELVAAPTLKGREFPNHMPGFFDLIGLVQSRKKGDQIIYPPMVYFESPDRDFMCKFTGTGKKRQGPLDFSKILKVK
jgi:hypothetical protein